MNDVGRDEGLAHGPRVIVSCQIVGSKHHSRPCGEGATWKVLWRISADVSASRVSAGSTARGSRAREPPGSVGHLNSDAEEAGSDPVLRHERRFYPVAELPSD